MDEQFVQINFLEVQKNSKCVERSMRLPYKSLETIVEMCSDYSRIVMEKSKGIDEDHMYKKKTYEFKAKEIQDLGIKIAGEINYNKSCSKNKHKSDIGGDAFELLVNGYER